ncbi:MAG: hypothetical protein E7Z81_07280 [Methanobrevibacter sp.]|uniref:hypothetical protein n=1 Tax=Methanobrevibacter sp. TaxID=66852 RepID=UPI0025ECE03D|nr:hypothetical protein [Methanobrevibacter sp.]MBE6498062.1 hypothetical protein [Methanobrevibacter sp.]MBE6499351.1 hypothetical protein [Methanobrevibacter thaueri]
MIEADYNKWLNYHRDTENFETLSEPIKKAIYKMEQEFKDNEEVELTNVSLYDNGFELNFDWLGYHEECVRAGQIIFEACEHDKDENPDYDDFYDMGQESVGRAGYEEMHQKICDYLNPQVSSDSIKINM